MKTLVETYEVEETSSEAASLAADSEAMELIDKLGLEGQRSLSNPETITRAPYRKLTAEERFVYRILCPQTSDLKTYREGPIPVRVLQVAAHAMETGLYWKCVVWHPRSRLEKDPILIGYFKTGKDEWYRDDHILARWGEELPHPNELLPRAKKIWAEQVRQKLLKIQTQVGQHIDQLKAIASTDAMPEEVSDPHYSFTI